MRPGARDPQHWANAANLLLKLLGRSESVLDIRPIVTAGGSTWPIHRACAQEHRALLDEMHSRLPGRPAISYELRSGRSRIQFPLGLREADVVELLGPPFAEINYDVYLAFRCDVPAFGRRTSQINFLLYDVLGTPGRLLRIAVDESSAGVMGYEEVPTSEQPLPVQNPAEPGGWRVGAVDIPRGMPQSQVVALLGEPLSRSGLGDYLSEQLSVSSFGPEQDFELWLFDAHPTPGWLVRIEFREGRVSQVDEVPT